MMIEINCDEQTMYLNPEYIVSILREGKGIQVTFSNGEFADFYPISDAELKAILKSFEQVAK